LVHELPWIVAISFSVSLAAGAIFEFRRLIGGRVLGSFLLGTYHRPRCEQRIVMFLDIAGSTALAEQLGELRVHDLITSFFFFPACGASFSWPSIWGRRGLLGRAIARRPGRGFGSGLQALDRTR
jgi:hypothetical protein